MSDKGRRVIIFILLAVILFAFPGCQLAREGAAGEEARMVGVFITTEHLDLFDHSLIDQPIPMRWGRPDFSALFQPGRLYAQWVESIGDFRFPGVEGIPFFAAYSPPHLPDTTMINHAGSGISSGHTHVFVGDNYHRVEKEGTIYVVPGAQASTFVVVNQVFQKADGSVFLMSGSSSAFSFHGNKTEGPVFSQNVSETRTETINRVETTNCISVTVNITTMFEPKSIVLLQMDEYSQVVLRTEFAPGEMPQTFYPESQTAYIIVETHRDRPYSHEQVVREIVARDWHSNNRFSTFVAMDDGVLLKNWTEIAWDSQGL